MVAKPDLCPACGTFVRMSWTTSCESCGADLFAEAETAAQEHAERPGRATSHRSDDRTPGNGGVAGAMLIAAVLVAVAVIGGVFMFGGSGKESLATGAAESGASATTPTTRPPTSAESVFLPSAAFGAKWKPFGVEHSTSAQLTGNSSCFPDDPLMKNIAISTQTYSYNEQANGQQGAALVYSVRVSDSVATAKHQHERVNSKEYEACAISAAKETMLRVAGQGAIAENVKLQRVLRDGLAVPYVDYRVTAKVWSMIGINNVTSEVIFLQHGDARLRLEFFDCGCKLGPPTDKDAIIAAAATALAAVPE
jgi:hypothetical protein